MPKMIDPAVRERAVKLVRCASEIVHQFRVWFGEVSHHPHHDVEAALTDLGALIEWSSTNMCAVDARDAAHAQVIADYLAEREDAGDLIYETGRTA